MIRLLVEIINFIGCVLGGLFSLIGIALIFVCIVAGLLAWACFEVGSELYKAHSPKEGTS